jgi:hypothetical protein
MAQGADVSSEVEYGGRAHPLLHLLAPLVAAGAVWVARTGIGITYERLAGRKRPVPSDPETTWRHAIAWTAVTATTAAVIEVTVRRVANKRRVHEILQRGREVSEVVTRRHTQQSGQRMPEFVGTTLKEWADERSAARKAMGSGG